MATQSAAPEGSLAATSGSGRRSGNTATIAQLQLAPHIVSCLEQEGIRTLKDWQRLSPKRRRGIFGVTSIMMKQLDAAARKARK